MLAELNVYRSEGFDRLAVIPETHRYEATREFIYNSGEFIWFLLRDIFTLRNLIFAGLFFLLVEIAWIVYFALAIAL